LSQENYDKWYDQAVLVSKIGIDAIRDKADERMEHFMVHERQVPCAFDW
jgi:hypothetical protein